MRFLTSILAVSALAFATAVFAGEFNDECAWGLANGKHVKTDCSVNMKDSKGRTYCFSSADAKASFLKDTKGNMKKAEKAFGRG